MEANILAHLSTLGQIPHGCPERQAFLCPCLTDEETQQSQMPRLRCGRRQRMRWVVPCRRQRMRWVAPALLAARSLCPPTTTCYPSHPSHRQSLERGRRHFRYGAREAPVEGYKTQEHSVLKKKKSIYLLGRAWQLLPLHLPWDSLGHQLQGSVPCECS